MVEENVIAQLNNIKTHPCVAVGLRNNALRLHGWVYDIESGEIRTLDKTAKPTFPLLKPAGAFRVILPLEQGCSG